MLAASLIFFPPDLLRRFVHAVKSTGHSGLENEAPKPVAATPALEVETCGPLSTRQKRIAWLMTAYLGLHFMLPLRHYLYPGNVSWTEEGHNFAWHMKLRTKRGKAIFTVTHPASGQTWTVDPATYMPDWQLRKMATKPDLIVQFAHYLVEQKRREGYDGVEVRVEVTSSLNGRKPQVMIDPNVDLAKERVSLLPARWILPLTTALGDRGMTTQEDQEPEN